MLGVQVINVCLLMFNQYLLNIGDRSTFNFRTKTCARGEGGDLCVWGGGGTEDKQSPQTVW